MNRKQEIMAITDLYSDYYANKITMGELYDGVHTIIDTATREAISEYIEPHLRACRDYNGREWCKNCGLRPLQEQSGGSDDI